MRATRLAQEAVREAQEAAGHAQRAAEAATRAVRAATDAEEAVSWAAHNLDRVLQEMGYWQSSDRDAAMDNYWHRD